MVVVSGPEQFFNVSMYPLGINHYRFSLMLDFFSFLIFSNNIRVNFVFIYLHFVRKYFSCAKHYLEFAPTYLYHLYFVRFPL